MVSSTLSVANTGKGRCAVVVLHVPISQALEVETLDTDCVKQSLLVRIFRIRPLNQNSSLRVIPVY